MVMIIRFYLQLVLINLESFQATSKNLGINISKIGKIGLNNKKSLIIDQKGEHLLIKKQGYKHQF